METAGAVTQAGRIFDFGADGRALGMGSAYSAVAREATSLYYNPSGLGLLDNRQVSLMHAQLFGGAAYDYLGYAQNFRKIPGGWGVQVLRLGVSGVESRDSTNNLSGNFGYSEMSVGTGFGLRGFLLPELSLGGGFKMLNRSLAGSSDRLLGLDLGTQYGPLLDERLTLGFVVQNAVTLSQGDTSDSLPLKLRMGAAYRVLGPVLLSIEAADFGALRIGTEYSIGIAALRAGYSPQGISFGGGVGFRKGFTLDLAMLNHSTLGLSQRVSMGYHFGGAEKPKKRTSMAIEYFANGKAELDRRQYVRACNNLETALGIDSSIDDGQWKRKTKRLRSLLNLLKAEGQIHEDVLAAESEPARIAQRAIAAYLSGDKMEAMLLAHAAVGSAERDWTFMKLLQSLSKLTGQPLVKEDILPARSLTHARSEKAVEAIYGRRYETAIALCQEAILISPEDAEAWARLGSAYFASGDRAKAHQAYKKALQFDPSDSKLRAFMKQNFNE